MRAPVIRLAQSAGGAIAPGTLLALRTFGLNLGDRAASLIAPQVFRRHSAGPERFPGLAYGWPYRHDDAPSGEWGRLLELLEQAFGARRQDELPRIRVDHEPNFVGRGHIKPLKARQRAMPTLPPCRCGRAESHGLDYQPHRQRLDDVALAVEAVFLLLNEAVSRPVLPRRPGNPSDLEEVSLTASANTVRRCVHDYVHDYADSRPMPSRSAPRHERSDGDSGRLRRASDKPCPVVVSMFLDRMERVTRQSGQRWRDAAHERYYEWDRRHGHVEVYDKRGDHLGAADAATGELIRGPVPGRRIDV